MAFPMSSTATNPLVTPPTSVQTAPAIASGSRAIFHFGALQSSAAAVYNPFALAAAISSPFAAPSSPVASTCSNAPALAPAFQFGVTALNSLVSSGVTVISAAVIPPVSFVAPSGCALTCKQRANVIELCH